jgi:hypothetical protein
LPGDLPKYPARNILALIRADQGKPVLALKEAKRAYRDALGATISSPVTRRNLLAVCGRTLAAQHVLLGQTEEDSHALAAVCFYVCIDVSSILIL